MESEKIREITTLDEFSTSNILEELEEKKKIDRHLPGGGFLHISQTLPYLVVHRLKKESQNAQTNRIVINEASYLIIGTTDFEGYQRLMLALGEKLSAKFKSFLFFEIYSGSISSKNFVVRGPAELLPSTFKVLKNELEEIKNNFFQLGFQIEIESTKKRQEEGRSQLLSIDEIHQAGCLLIGLEIPWVHHTEEGGEFPIFFRNFKDLIVKAVHKVIFDFIRVQTSCGVASYAALGRKFLQKKVFDIDRKLSEIERSFQFLLLVAPVNIQQVKKVFFESNFQEVPEYHYRLLPIDPDILKRTLFNLKIEKVDDPAISFLFREKREELDHQITMLNERGTKNFFYNSIRLHNTVEPFLKEAALFILKNVPEKTETVEDTLVGAKDFAKLAEKEFEYFREQDPEFKSRIHIKDTINILMVSRGELYIPAQYKMNQSEAKALIQHEVGTHILTYHNGMQQPLEQLAVGLANYDPLQEGLAVLSEYLVGGLTANRMRILAGRVIGGIALLEGKDFKEIFQVLHDEYNFSPERAFNITSRMMQGGGFLKDIIYLKGLVKLREYLREGNELEPLLIGKFSLEQSEAVFELYERNILKNGILRPSYLNSKEAQHRLEMIRDGLPLSEMINAGKTA
ncbi:MAG TPA: tyrosine/phenylalanine carboxypeptidase domain-containing protein [Flavobacteriaceae bacterium]|nr:tyrosine/phenylalanine carboxypeptidase domain-containing protein [Flavobacteriaceae bacterium]